jgi:multidrug efflux pump subunit AcrB
MVRGDHSLNIRKAFADIQVTMAVTLVLVVGVIFLFLRNASATLIPALALPFSILGTFGVMRLLGYNLDNLSMMALLLSIGFVVDDAIVMLENIVRHMEHGESPLEASREGSRQITFTIASMTLSLATVFIPILFMRGILGPSPLVTQFSKRVLMAGRGFRADGTPSRPRPTGSGAPRARASCRSRRSATAAAWAPSRFLTPARGCAWT